MTKAHKTPCADPKCPQVFCQEKQKGILEEIPQSDPFIVVSHEQLAALKKALGEDV